ncbi:hypothetical protein FRB91_005513, partial [Serendipita sp. 411]
FTPSPTPASGSGSGLEKGQVELAEGDADPEADNDAVAATSNGKANGIEKKEEGLTGRERERVKGEPTTGFGRTPVGQREIWETALVILIPGVLLTFEQGIRTSQAFYTPKVGRSPPWVSGNRTFSLALSMMTDTVLMVWVWIW